MSPRRRPKPSLPAGSESLKDLAAETRALVERLGANVRANPERLSVSMLNNAVVAILRNQQAILDALAELSRSSSGEKVAEAPRAAPEPRGNGTESASPPSAAFPVREKETSSGDAPAPPSPALPLRGRENSEEALRGREDSAQGDIVDGSRSRGAIAEFDIREQSYERGLEKLNAWLAGGRGGTPFQKREEHAYLNFEVPESMRVQIEEHLMGREGYGLRLGRLRVEGLKGEVVIYAKSRDSSVAPRAVGGDGISPGPPVADRGS